MARWVPLVASARTPDYALNWRPKYVPTGAQLGRYDASRVYQEGPNECDIVLLKDGRTLWAVMRVDGGDGQLDGRTLPRIAATSVDEGVTWVPSPSHCLSTA